MRFPYLDAKQKLIRIMGTFDLATGHADTFDELLNSLEVELRDVLGHYREALKVKTPQIKELSDEEIQEVAQALIDDCSYCALHFARAILRKVQEK
jgi:hypothetical protein